MVDLRKIALDDTKDGLSDDEHLAHVLSEILIYFADKYSSDRTMRRRFARTMESIADIMVDQGYWGRDPYPKD